MLKSLIYYLKNRSISLEEQELYKKAVADHEEYVEKFKAKYARFLEEKANGPMYSIEPSEDNSRKYVVKRMFVSSNKTYDHPKHDVLNFGHVRRVLMPVCYARYKRRLEDDLVRDIWSCMCVEASFYNFSDAEKYIKDTVKGIMDTNITYYDARGAKINA